MNGVDTMGNDIPGAAFGNATVDSCSQACNKNDDCAGFILDVGGNYNKTCFPKTKSMFFSILARLEIWSSRSAFTVRSSFLISSSKILKIPFRLLLF